MTLVESVSCTLVASIEFGGDVTAAAIYTILDLACVNEPYS